MIYKAPKSQKESGRMSVHVCHCACALALLRWRGDDN